MISLEELISRLEKSPFFTQNDPQIAPKTSLKSPKPLSVLMPETVMITGAGGTIGSALAKHLLATGRANRFVLVDSSELALYTINRELVALGASTCPCLCSYGDDVLGGVIADYQPTTVYHAGAYKHVPMVEANWKSGVKNNVFEADRLFRLIESTSVKTLIVISSDKAVKPTTIMGATKRLVEDLAINCKIENVKVVRFGNVLGSSGSVVPLFYEQITSSQEVTITHPEVTRYFMSVAEAVSLVVGCAHLEGTRFLLSMGTPKKVEHLAHQIASILGTPALVKYIGLREGEKLHEELTSTQVETTGHPRIHKVIEPVIAAAVLSGFCNQLQNTHTYQDAKNRLTAMGVGYQDTNPFTKSVLVAEQYDPAPEYPDCFKKPLPYMEL